MSTNNQTNQDKDKYSVIREQHTKLEQHLEADCHNIYMPDILPIATILKSDGGTKHMPHVFFVGLRDF